MSIEITTRHGEISALAQDFAREKAQIIEGEFQKVGDIHVTLESDAHIYRAQFVVVQDGEQIVGQAESDVTVNKAIDDAAEKVTRQIRKHREKQTSTR